MTTRTKSIDDIRKQIRALEALHYANMQLTSSLELKPVMQKILEQVLLLVIPKDVSIFFFEGERLLFDAALWAGNIQDHPFFEPIKDGVVARVAKSGKKMVIPDLSVDPLFKEHQWIGAVIGLAYGFVDGFIGGFLLALIYNGFLPKQPA